MSTIIQCVFCNKKILKTNVNHYYWHEPHYCNKNKIVHYSVDLNRITCKKVYNDILYLIRYSFVEGAKYITCQFSKDYTYNEITKIFEFNPYSKVCFFRTNLNFEIKDLNETLENSIIRINTLL